MAAPGSRRHFIDFDRPLYRFSGHQGMSMHERFALTEDVVSGAAAPHRGSWFRSACGRVGEWRKTFSHYSAAAAAYEVLSDLSDTQLKHRELGRDILARDLRGPRRGENRNERTAPPASPAARHQ